MARVELTRDEREMLLNSSKENKNMYLDSMLRRFKKLVMSEGILDECKKREYFLKKSLRRKEKSKRARIKLIKQHKLKSRRTK